MKKIVSLVLVLAMALICSAAFAEGGIPADQIKVGYIYIGDENEGYTAAHYEGAKEMMADAGPDRGSGHHQVEHSRDRRSLRRGCRPRRSGLQHHLRQLLQP